jgi:hypothetical protein
MTPILKLAEDEQDEERELGFELDYLALLKLRERRQLRNSTGEQE